jgi:hypothetical protein
MGGAFVSDISVEEWTLNPTIYPKKVYWGLIEGTGGENDVFFHGFAVCAPCYVVFVRFHMSFMSPNGYSFS